MTFGAFSGFAAQMAVLINQTFGADSQFAGQFDGGGFTILSQDHLDFHPTMEDYFAAKAALFDAPQAAAAALQGKESSLGGWQ